MEATVMSVDRRMDKEGMVHIYNGVILNHKKEWNNAICSNRDGLEMTVLCKVSQKEKDKHHIISLMWNLKYDINEAYSWHRNRLTDTENKLLVAEGKGGWGREELGIWD